MSSMFMLPENADKRQLIFKEVFDSGAGMAFALEDLRVFSIEETADIETQLTAYHLLGDCPQSMELDSSPVSGIPDVPGWTAPAGDDWNPRG